MGRSLLLVSIVAACGGEGLMRDAGDPPPAPRHEGAACVWESQLVAENLAVSRAHDLSLIDVPRLAFARADKTVAWVVFEDGAWSEHEMFPTSGEIAAQVAIHGRHGLRGDLSGITENPNLPLLTAHGMDGDGLLEMREDAQGKLHALMAIDKTAPEGVTLTLAVLGHPRNFRDFYAHWVLERGRWTLQKGLEALTVRAWNVDGEGGLHVVFEQAGQLFYQAGDNAPIALETNGVTAARPALLLDDEDVPHVVVAFDGEAEVWLIAPRENGEWTHEVLWTDDTGAVRGVSAAWDEAGRLHFVADGAALTYVHQDERGRWAAESIADKASPAGFSPELRIRKQQMAASYLDADGLKYATRRCDTTPPL